MLNLGREFAVEIHPADWRFSAEKSWVAGWIRPQSDQVITDVRARLHHRVILGLSGLPHPAFSERLPGQDVSSRPGFSFLLAPQPGATLLRLEARDQSGLWREFFRTKITASPDAPAPAPILGLNESLSRLVTILLRRRMCTPERDWDDLTDDLVTAFVAEPLNTHPNAPFVGALEEPQDIGRLRYGRIPVTGWLAHTSARIVRLTAVIDPLPATALPRSVAREDISWGFPALCDHANASFAGDLTLPVGLAAPVLLKLIAELDNGEQHLVFARRFTPRFHDDSGMIPPLVSSLTFARAIWSLLLSSGRHAQSRHGLLQAARTIWTSYRAMPVYCSRRILPGPDPTAYPAHNGPPRQNPADAKTTSRSLPFPVGNGLPACTLISPADDMSVPDTSHYFQVGREALKLAQEAYALAGNDRVESILDLPCGFGRVARWLRMAYPTAKLTVSDTQRAGVDFCVEHLGATGVHATIDGRHWPALAGPYDIIWCGSLLTHFDWEQWVGHLRRFGERLSSHGVLVFTSHGMLALERLQSGEKDYGLPQAAVARLCTAAVAEGFGYVDYPDTPAYGISVAQPGWIRELVARETNLHVLGIRASAWGQHQDVIICIRRAPIRKDWWRKLISPTS